MTCVTVYAGAQEIGGNQLLLEDPEGSLLLDFGKPLGTYSRYFTGHSGPLSARGLHDHLLMGLLPPLQGLYREDLLPDEWAPWASLPSVRTVRPNAILLTHAHLDHCGSLPYLDPAIPVMMSPGTAMTLKHLQDWGPAHLDGELRYVKRRALRNGALTVPRSRWEGRLRLRQAQIPPAEPWDRVAALWAEAPDERPWEAPAAVRSDRVGGLEVRWFPVDHSMTGSGAFAVRTRAGWVVYTGDLRRHGRQDDLTDAFIREAAGLQPAVLITEGTNAGGPASPTEGDVQERIAEAVQKARGLVVAVTSARNADRLLTLYEAARAAGRRLLLTEREADFLRHHRPLRPELPDPDADPHLCTYFRPRPTDDTWQRFWRPDRRTKGGARAGARQVRSHPEEYLVCFGLPDMVELIGLKPKPGGLLIYANHRPYDAEQAADLERLQAWAALLEMKVAGMNEPGYHASGHMGGEELAAMIRTINPARLIPVHTENPAFFSNLEGPWRLSLPAPGQSISL